MLRRPPLPPPFFLSHPLSTLPTHLPRSRFCSQPRHSRKKLFPHGQRRRSSTLSLIKMTAINNNTNNNGNLPDVLKGGNEMGNRYEASEYEEMIYKWWEANGYFRPVPKNVEKDGDKFVMCMPPPNVTGGLHMGHAMFVSVEDVLVRYNRMLGKETLYLPGSDHAGIATQMLVEREILDGEGLRKEDLGRDGFIGRVWKWKGEKGGYIGRQLRRLGASCDWGRERFTLDEGMSRAVNKAFVRFWEEGLVYRGARLVNWAPGLQTAVSDLEVESKIEEGVLYYFKYPVKGGGFFPVATTRPETILGDMAVCVHPHDERFKELVGGVCVVPFVGREIPIISDEYVDRELGTGALKITPGHDGNDYEIGKRHGLNVMSIFNKDASICEEIRSPYSGLDRFEARKRIWRDLEEQGLVIRAEKHESVIPRSQRGGEIIEPMVSTQWFMKMDTLARPAIDAVKSNEIAIVPQRFTKVYMNWLENIQDWCISRQLWWGHRIPVYYVDGKDDEFVVAESIEKAQEMANRKYGKEVSLTQDPDVLDTWFSSGLWPFSTMGWGQNGVGETEQDDMARFYPGTVLETGYDILFFWVARMIMMGINLTGKIPFSVVYMHGLVRDAKGKKMSKTTGNVIDPLDTIGQYGADALRYSLVTGSTPGQDIPLSLEKVESNRNFTTKLWNICRFVLGNIGDLNEEDRKELASLEQSGFGKDISEMQLAEKYILSKLHSVVARVSTSFEKYDFGDAGRQVHDFLWDEFADWYVEVCKPTLWASGKEGRTMTSAEQVSLKEKRKTLVYVLDTCLRVLHPFMPHVTEVLWHRLPRDYDTQTALIVASWPRGGDVDDGAVERFSRLQALIRAVRNVRADYQVPSTNRVQMEVHGDSRTCKDVMINKDMLSLLAKIDANKLSVKEVAQSAENGNPQKVDDGTIQLIIADCMTAYIPMQGLIDVEKERARLEKQLGKLEKESEGVHKRLSSPGFTNKAPQQVVQAAQSNACELEGKILALHARIKELEKMGEGP